MFPKAAKEAREARDSAVHSDVSDGCQSPLEGSMIFGQENMEDELLDLCMKGHDPNIHGKYRDLEILGLTEFEIQNQTKLTLG